MPHLTYIGGRAFKREIALELVWRIGNGRLCTYGALSTSLKCV